MLLKEFADHLGVSASRLSNVEFGERSVPDPWFDKICKMLDLSLPEMAELKKSMLRSKRTFSIEADTDEKREVLVAFMEHMDEIDKEKSKKIIAAVTHTGTRDKETERVCRRKKKT